jgi:hypothetical protein
MKLPMPPDPKYPNSLILSYSHTCSMSKSKSHLIKPAIEEKNPSEMHYKPVTGF